MAELRRMERLMRSRADFVDFISVQQRKRQLADYDARIVALQHAKQELQDKPLYRMQKTEYKNIETLCYKNGWAREDADEFVEAFLRKHPSRAKSKVPMSNIVSGVSKLGDALSIA